MIKPSERVEEKKPTNEKRKKKRKSGKFKLLITYVTSKCVYEMVGNHPRSDKHLRYKHYWPLSSSTDHSRHNRYQEVEL